MLNTHLTPNRSVFGNSLYLNIFCYVPTKKNLFPLGYIYMGCSSSDINSAQAKQSESLCSITKG